MEFKIGEEVLVRDYDYEDWQKRIFICKKPEGYGYPYVVLEDYYSLSYRQIKKVEEKPSLSLYTIKELADEISRRSK